MDVTLFGILTEFNNPQYAKRLLLIEVILPCISMEVKESQFENAQASIKVTLFGITMEDNQLSKKASEPMDVTLLGITMDFNPQFWKAPSPIEAILLGITTELTE
jgi:hypothetical protein